MSSTWLNDCLEVAVSTSNLNGWFTAVEVGKPSKPRKYLYLKMRREPSIHIAAFQEHHVSSSAVVASEEVWLHSNGFGVLAHLQECGGVGGVGVLWKYSDWSLRAACSFRSLGPRFMVVELEDGNGFLLRIVSAHFDCSASVRRKQWVALGEELRRLPSRARLL